MAETSPIRNQMDAAAISLKLRVSEAPQGMTEAEIDESIAEIAHRAYRRTVMDQCGGLPGPPIENPTLTRKILDRLQTFTNRFRSEKYPL